MPSPRVPLLELISQLFQAFEIAGVHYVVLGRISKMDIDPSAEVDIAVLPHQVRSARREFRDFVEHRQGALIQSIWHDLDGVCYVARIPVGKGAFTLTFDIGSDFFMGARLISTSYDLICSRKFLEPAPGWSVYVPDAPQAFICYLQKRVMKSDVPVDAQTYLHDLFAEDPEGCRRVLRQKWSSNAAAALERAVCAGDWRAVNFGVLRVELCNRNRPSVRNCVREFARYVYRVCYPDGFTVAILGPDGSGKTTLLRSLSDRLKSVSRRAFFYHLFPPIRTGSESGIVVTNPHGKPSRGVPMSITKLLYLVFVYNVGWCRSVWLQRRRTGAIYFDRYYHDLIADPLRYRNSAPAWIVHLIGHVIPEPDVFLILDVAPEIVRARKTEVSVEESERQFQAYRGLGGELKGAFLIDASLSPEDVATQCERVVLELMAQRMARRA